MSTRILYCHPGAELYGADRMALITAEGLAQSGHFVKVVLPNSGPLESKIRAADINVELVNVPVLRKSALTITGMGRLLAASVRGTIKSIRVIRKFDPDVVYANTITQPIWFLAAKICRRKLVCHVRESESGAHPIIRKGLLLPLALADDIIANSMSTLEFVRQSLYSRARVKTHVVYNGKDWSKYLRNEPQMIQQPVRILLVGRLSPRKGQDVAVHAIGIIRRLGIDCTLRLAGDTFPGYEWFEDELLDIEKRLGLSANVTHVGFVDDIPKELEWADVVLVPSRQEPFGTVAAEAMAAMRPVIVSGVEGLTEIVEHGRTGLVVPPESPEELSNAILRLVKDPSMAAKLAKNGYERVNREFSLINYRRRIELVLVSQENDGNQ
ncbi:glycosyltransferase family 4 protein [Rhodococcus gordoniae]|uniref:glycosyltransferase family 4 protein n=1 Tax=Rhodococcus gordoniae TaxID=223392 RepID=UPI0020CFE410|nr:glycosyltransferase family 4 protein [Rhodococcus gordoniae]UTT48042.1 glycosyltransferase family 4 protein [Rhodococcus gordoniae]